MRYTTLKAAAALAVAALLSTACTAPGPVARPDEPQALAEPAQTAPETTAAEPRSGTGTGFRAGVPAGTPLPAVKQGAIERIDCTSGVPDRHARIAIEAQSGQVLGFAYYSKWKPRTCSLEFMRNSAGSKWTMTSDGALRVQTTQGRFLIRSSPDAYVFEFERVRRQKFCGMPGEINGTMTVRRGPGTPQCWVKGIMDANDPYLDHLYKLK